MDFRAVMAPAASLNESGYYACGLDLKKNNKRQLEEASHQLDKLQAIKTDTSFCTHS
jgi:hypothetical protein